MKKLFLAVLVCLLFAGALSYSKEFVDEDCDILPKAKFITISDCSAAAGQLDSCLTGKIIDNLSKLSPPQSDAKFEAKRTYVWEFHSSCNRKLGRSFR